MAIYYVRNDGNDLNTGLASGTGSAWATLTKALGSSGISGGDTLYIAPGIYREIITLGFSSSASTTFIYGDPLATKFSGVSAGPIRITPFTNGDDNSESGSNTITGIGKSNVRFESLLVESYASGIFISNCQGFQFENLVFQSTINLRGGIGLDIQQDYCYQTHKLEKCIMNAARSINFRPSAAAVGTTIGPQAVLNADTILSTNINFFYSYNNRNYYLDQPMTFSNITAISQTFFETGGTGGTKIIFNNCAILGSWFIGMNWVGFGHAQVNYSRGNTENGQMYNGNTGLGNNMLGYVSIDQGESKLFGLSNQQMYSTKFQGNLYGTGNTSVFYPLTDLYGNPWPTGLPDIGAITYNNTNTVSRYLPTDKINTNFTLVPGSSSESINLYLGATGISYNSTGLTAYYIRQNSSPVSIGLTAQSPNGNWVSGGLAEINSTTQPGLYRFDIPNEAIAPGVKNVTLSITGGGVNGAYAYCELINTRLPDVESRSFISGNTSLIEYINITQSNSGTALTGLSHNSEGLTAYYVRPNGIPTQISLVSQTVNGSFAGGGFTSVNNLTMPGLYRIDIPNSVFTVGVSSATVYLRGAANMNPIRIEYK